jgi:hypothetical protein
MTLFILVQVQMVRLNPSILAAASVSYLACTQIHIHGHSFASPLPLRLSTAAPMAAFRGPMTVG